MEFKEKLKVARKEINITQEGLAKMLEVPKRTIESWESGDRRPPDYVQRLIISEIKRKKPE